MNPSFNALDEKWIPVRYLDGRTDELGLLQLFTDAGLIGTLAETEPPNLIALYRLLLAITHRAFFRQFGHWTTRDVARCYREGLPVEAIHDYLQHWRERFWLFHPEQPFMQVAALAEAEETRDKFKPWTQIALDRTTGNAPVLFDHSVDSIAKPVSMASVLRKLLGFLQCTPGGLVKALRDSDKAGPLANTAAVLPLGHSLAETLCLALHPARDDMADDLPAWERAPVTLANLCAAPTLASGPNDRYTRLSRAVLLRRDGEEDQTISTIHFAAGLALADDENAPDPMASYRAGSNGMVRLGFTAGRAVWRDLSTLLPSGPGTQTQQAAVLGWAATLMERVMPSEEIELPALVTGLASDQAKLLRWRIERLVLPAALLLHADAASYLRDRQGEAEELFSQLRSIAAGMLADTMPDPNHKDTRSRARSIVDNGAAATNYFSTLERSLPRLLAHCAHQQFDQASAHWKAAQLSAAGQAWSAACGQLDSSAAALRARARAEGRYLCLLKPLRLATVPSNKETQA